MKIKCHYTGKTFKKYLTGTIQPFTNKGHNFWEKLWEQIVQQFEEQWTHSPQLVTVQKMQCNYSYRCEDKHFTLYFAWTRAMCTHNVQPADRTGIWIRHKKESAYDPMFHVWAVSQTCDRKKNTLPSQSYQLNPYMPCGCTVCKHRKPDEINAKVRFNPPSHKGLTKA